MSEFVDKTIGATLRDAAETSWEREALVYPQSGFRQDYGSFLTDCQAAAKGLMALGIRRGDHVSVWATNVREWIHLQFGLGMIGAVQVTVNTSYRSHELAYILGQSESTTLIFSEGVRDTSFHDIARDLPASASLPNLKNVVALGSRAEDPRMIRFDHVLAMGEGVSDAELARREARLHPDDVVNIQYTSGTTGFPKGVMLTHHNIVNNARMVGDVMGMSGGDRLLIQVPLFHCFGCVMSTLNCVCHGSTMVVLEAFDPLEALRAIHEERCTAVNGVPTMFIAMLNHPDFDAHDLSTLRTGIMAGAPCPVDTMNLVRSRMHCREIVIAFGQTECSPVMTMTRRNDPVHLRVSTVGRLLPGVEGRIVDPGSGAPLPPGTQGEIVTRSPCVMKGYYNMPEATAEAIDHEGWLHTGDLGTVDEAGYFRVTGRIKDMIIRGGENIYPREIEEFLMTHPKVRDVHVVGVADPKYGEQVLAAVQLHDGVRAGEEEFTEFCAGEIARYKIPKYWRFVDEFPLTASGKVQKYRLREMFGDVSP